MRKVWNLRMPNILRPYAWLCVVRWISGIVCGRVSWRGGVLRSAWCRDESGMCSRLKSDAVGRPKKGGTLGACGLRQKRSDSLKQGNDSNDDGGKKVCH